MTSISEYAQPTDSVSLTKLGDKPFTIVAVENSAYEKEQNGVKEEIPGVKITTKEFFDIDVNGGTEQYNKFHTTRKAIVSTLTVDGLWRAINEEKKEFKVKCKKVRGQNGGNEYYVLDDA